MSEFDDMYKLKDYDKCDLLTNANVMVKTKTSVLTYIDQYGPSLHLKNRYKKNYTQTVKFMAWCVDITQTDKRQRGQTHAN